MTDSKPLRLTIALSAIFVGLALIFATVFPVVAHQLGWLPANTAVLNGTMMQGWAMHNGYMNGGVMPNHMGGSFNTPMNGLGLFGVFFWPLIVIGLVALVVFLLIKSYRPVTETVNKP